MSTSTAENTRPAGRLERAARRLALAGFFVYALAAPHSIAGSWIGLSAAVLAWIVRAVATRRTGVRRTPLDLPLLLFFAWTALSCFLSAEPRVSIPKLVNVSTLLMFYLAQSLLTRRTAVLLACVLVVSASAGVLWGAGELVVGRGVIVRELSADSPLGAGLRRKRDEERARVGTTNASARVSSSEDSRKKVRQGLTSIALPAVAFVILAAGIALTAMRTTLVAFAIGACVVAWRAARG